MVLLTGVTVMVVGPTAGHAAVPRTGRSLTVAQATTVPLVTIGNKKSAATGTRKVLGIESPRTVPGSKVIQWTVSGAPDQAWLLQGGFDDNKFALRSGANQDFYAMSIEGNSGADNANILQWQFSNTNVYEQWQFFEVEPLTYHIVNVKTHKCLAIAGGGSTATGAQAVQWTCGPGDDQKWTLEAW